MIPKRIKYQGQEYKLVESKSMDEMYRRSRGKAVKYLSIDSRREAYNLDQIDVTMTVGELKDYLEQFNEDTPVIINNDKGYTYGSITEDSFRTEYPDSDDDDDDYDESLRTRKSSGIKETKLNESNGMRKYTQRELRDMIRTGMAKELTSFADRPKDYDKIGYSSGTYGINGGLIQDRETGEYYVIPDRSSLLLRIF